MIRRLGAALITLALALPAFALTTPGPAAAHSAGGFSLAWGWSTGPEGTSLNGMITSHLSSRRTNIQITATWKDGATVMATETTTAMVNNLAPHARSPFQMFEETEVDAEWDVTMAVTSAPTNVTPAGAMTVDPGEFIDEDTYEGTVTNHGSTAAQNVVVYGNRFEAVYRDAEPSGTIASIPAGGSATYTIDFDPDSVGESVRGLIATTNAGTFYTSWNNYFGDLVTSSFADAIAWMAEEGITAGCGNASFCPKSSVTRGQMAVFLSRALDLPPADHQGFEDIGSLSATFRAAINSLAAAGITGGCVDNGEEKLFCPSSSVTRGQMSRFIVTGYGDEGGRDIAPIAGSGPFTDDNGHFSEPYNNAMADAGITGGCAAGKYCPNANVLREQMAIFMLRASQLDPAAP
jgi:hypothetical protein